MTAFIFKKCYVVFFSSMVFIFLQELPVLRPDFHPRILLMRLVADLDVEFIAAVVVAVGNHLF